MRVRVPPREAGEPETFTSVPELPVARAMVEFVRPLLLRVPESAGVKVKAPEALVMFVPRVSPLKEADVVARVSAPVCAEPYVWARERRPVFAMTPVDELYEMPRPPERLVEETLLLKVFQSVEERKPFCDADDWRMESVLPENVRGEEIAAEVTAAVPLPERIPESVVEPVPPTLTARVEVERSEVPSKYTGCPLVNDVAFVPPRAMGSVPEVICEAAMAMGVVAAVVSWPCAFTVKVATEEADP